MKMLNNFYVNFLSFCKYGKLGENQKYLVLAVERSIRNKNFSVEKAFFDTMEIRMGREVRKKFNGYYSIVFHDGNLSIAIDCPKFMQLSLYGGYKISVYNNDKNEVKDYSQYLSSSLRDLIEFSFLKSYQEKLKENNEKNDVSFLK